MSSGSSSNEVFESSVGREGVELSTWEEVLNQLMSQLALWKMRYLSIRGQGGSYRGSPLL